MRSAQGIRIQNQCAAEMAVLEGCAAERALPECEWQRRRREEKRAILSVVWRILTTHRLHHLFDQLERGRQRLGVSPKNVPEIDVNQVPLWA